MKNPLDPRHKKRQKAVEDLFRLGFHKQRIGDLARKVRDNQKSIDEKVASAAPEFPIDKINKIDLAILRLAVYEFMFSKDTPQKVIIDEAIELAKEYGGDTSPSFVNGALGKLIKNGKNSNI